jgi:hypothetical protein
MFPFFWGGGDDSVLWLSFAQQKRDKPINVSEHSLLYINIIIFLLSVILLGPDHGWKSKSFCLLWRWLLAFPSRRSTSGWAGSAGTGWGPCCEGSASWKDIPEIGKDDLTKESQKPGANLTIACYNASIGIFYNATGSMACFKNKKIFYSILKNAQAFYQRLYLCSCKFKCRRIASRGGSVKNNAQSRFLKQNSVPEQRKLTKLGRICSHWNILHLTKTSYIA